MEKTKRFNCYSILDEFIISYNICNPIDLNPNVIRVSLTSFLTKNGYEYIDFRNEKYKEELEYVISNINKNHAIDVLKKEKNIKEIKNTIDSITYCSCSHCTYRLCPKHIRNSNPNKKMFLKDYSKESSICRKRRSYLYKKRQEECQKIRERAEQAEIQPFDD